MTLEFLSGDERIACDAIGADPDSCDAAVFGLIGSSNTYFVNGKAINALTPRYFFKRHNPMPTKRMRRSLETVSDDENVGRQSIQERLALIEQAKREIRELVKVAFPIDGVVTWKYGKHWQVGRVVAHSDTSMRIHVENERTGSLRWLDIDFLYCDELHE